MKKLFIVLIIGLGSVMTSNVLADDWECPALPVGTIGIVGECRGFEIMGNVTTWCDTNAEGLGNCIKPLDEELPSG
ncbi:MAG: hypothetical protein ACQEW9_11415 [Bacteroidota bacterium]